MPPLIWTSPDYALDWPPELLREELTALLDHPYRTYRAGEVELLLREAFHTGVPADEYARLADADAWQDITPPDGARPAPALSGRWLDDLLAHLDRVREVRPPTPYWRARRAGAAAEPDEPPDIATAFAKLAVDLELRGYLAHRFGKACLDAEPDEYGDPPGGGEHPTLRIRAELQRRLHHPRLWPPVPSRWDTDTLYDVIEAVHDLVARPRSRWRHEHDLCGVHFEDFDPDAGRRVYRALVNRLLAGHDVNLRLAEHGEDEGRLVHVVDDARSDLIQRCLAASDDNTGGLVEHAIALFRARAATEHDKRSSIVALANVLGDRKRLLKDSLFTDDESALFHIANKFDLRHRNDKQHTDYDPAFRDWVFWWYLATVELTDRLLARAQAGHREPEASA